MTSSPRLTRRPPTIVGVDDDVEVDIVTELRARMAVSRSRCASSSGTARVTVATSRRRRCGGEVGEGREPGLQRPAPRVGHDPGDELRPSPAPPCPEAAARRRCGLAVDRQRPVGQGRTQLELAGHHAREPEELVLEARPSRPGLLGRARTASRAQQRRRRRRGRGWPTSAPARFPRRTPRPAPTSLPASSERDQRGLVVAGLRDGSVSALAQAGCASSRSATANSSSPTAADRHRPCPAGPRRRSWAATSDSRLAPRISGSAPASRARR